MNQVAQKAIMNVGEPWPLYDSICVTNKLYGSENNLNGWFTSFQTFALNEQHIFFKMRSEGVAGLAYNNQQSSDRLDYGFDAYSFGVSFKAPGTRYLGFVQENQFSPIDYPPDTFSAHWWECELPNHCAVQLKVQQDIVAEGPALDFPPGYGSSGGGAGMAQGETPAYPDNFGYCNYASTQGTPIFQNRHKFENPIGIPRDATIEGILFISDFAREILMGMGNVPNYLIPEPEQQNHYFLHPPARFMIQMSLLGVRYVQQRGQYHR